MGTVPKRAGEENRRALDARLLSEVRGGSYPHSGARRMCKGNQTESTEREEFFLRALLELYQDMSLQIPTKELNDMDSYRRLEEVMRCSN